MSPRTPTGERHDGDGTDETLNRAAVTAEEQLKELRAQIGLEEQLKELRAQISLEEQLKELQVRIDAVRDVLAVHFDWMNTMQAQLEDLTRQLRAGSGVSLIAPEHHRRAPGGGEGI
jgi:hypothetical protein